MRAGSGPGFVALGSKLEPLCKGRGAKSNSKAGSRAAPSLLIWQVALHLNKRNGLPREVVEDPAWKRSRSGGMGL